jgi:hypothetical protein
MVLLRVVPSFNQTVTHRVPSGLVRAQIVKVESCASECVLDVVDDGALDGLLIVADVRTH